MGAAGTAATDLYWWQLFDDTTLTRLIATAIENNRNVEIAFSRVEQARLTLKETRAGLWPSVSYGVTGQYGTESFIGLKSDKPVETYIIKPSISWELDLFGKIRRMSEADRAQLLATDRAAQGVLVSLVAEVASTYFSYLQYEYAGETARQTSISREATYALQQQSYAIGSIDELQLRQGEAAYATAAAANAQYERASEQALHALSLLLGQNPSQVVGKHTPLVDLRIPAEVPAGLPSDLLARRPDMVEAYYQVMAANAQIGVAQAMRFPSIALTGNGGVFSEEFKKLFDHNAWMWSAAGGITGPVFNFGANKRRVQIMREKHREAIMNYEQCFLQALREVEDALTAVRTYRTQLESMLTLVTAAEKSRPAVAAAVRRRTDQLLGRSGNATNIIRRAIRLRGDAQRNDEQLRHALQSARRRHHVAGRIGRKRAPQLSKRSRPLSPTGFPYRILAEVATRTGRAERTWKVRRKYSA